MPRPLHVFRAGTHTTNRGSEITISAQDVQQAIDAYDPELHRAPLVVGHPKGDGPAYGWATSFSSPDGVNLYAETSDVDATADLREWIEKGHLLGVSMSFYPPEHGSNPKPGNWYPRHVGFLGDQPPAVKGLTPPELSDDSETVTIELSEIRTADLAEPESVSAIASMFRNLRDMIIEVFGREEADRAMPRYQIDDLERTAQISADDVEVQLSERPESDPQFQTEDDPMADEQQTNTVDFAEREEELSQREQKLQEREEALQQQEEESRRQQAVSFSEHLVEQGKILPRHKELFTELQLASQANGAAPISFSEGDDDDAEEVDLAEGFRQFTEELGEVVQFSEAAPATNDREEEEEPAMEFHVPPGETVDEERAKLHARAKKYEREHSVSFNEAVRAVS